MNYESSFVLNLINSNHTLHVVTQLHQKETLHLTSSQLQYKGYLQQTAIFTVPLAYVYSM